MTTSPKTRQTLSLFALLLIGFLLFPALSQAHKIRVFAWIAGDTVTVESGFSGGRPLVQGSVDVQDTTTGASLLQGKTDAQGIFTFSLAETVKEQGMELRIIVSGGEGHRNEWLLLTGEEQDDVARRSDNTAGTAAAPEQTVSEQNSSAELTRILDQLLEEKLAPIRRSLARTEEQQPGFTDILGGIGYLIGLAGIIAWMKSRRK